MPPPRLIRRERGATGAWRQSSGSQGSRFWSLGLSRSAVQAGAFFGAGAALLVGVPPGAGRLAARAEITRQSPGRGSLADVAPRYAQRSLQTVAERHVGRADRLGGLHHRVGRCLPPRGRRALRGSQDRALADTCCWRESELPLVHDPNTPAGRDALLLQAPDARARPLHTFPRAEGRRRELPQSVSPREPHDHRRRAQRSSTRTASRSPRPLRRQRLSARTRG